MAEKSEFKILLMTIIAASAEPDSIDPKDDYVTNVFRHFAIIFHLENSSTNTPISTIFLGGPLLSSNTSNSFNSRNGIFGITHVPRQKYWPVMLVEHIASCFCSCFVAASEIFLRFGHQIHPVLSRLCAFIEGTSPSMLADCLGVDPSKFQSKSSEVANNDHSGSVIVVADDGCS
ncbi:hypothetical protein Tco_1433101, partial [Tanacetum coccineum]